MEASNFFESVCLSDKERVQSSIIAWIFSNECHAITLEDKRAALAQLLGVEKSKWNDINKMESEVEWQHMDILILLKENEVLKDVVVIENKIKCDLHNNQLTRYSTQLKNEKILDKNGKDKKELNPYCKATHHYGYLTLINHNSVTDENNIVWTNFTYKELYEELRTRLVNCNSSHVDYYITMSYIDALGNMTQIADLAIQNPSVLFLDKNCNSNQNFQKEWDYIRKYKLRHVLQVNYFESIKQEVETQINNYLNKYNGQTCTVRVSYGMQSDNAEIALDFKDGDLINNYLNFGGNSKGDFCIAVQNGTFKIAAAKDYNNTKNGLKNCELLERRGFMRSPGGQSIFDLYSSHIKQDNNNKKIWNVNNHKKDSNRPRMSISRGVSNNWFEQDQIIAEFKSCIDSLYDMLKLYGDEKDKHNWH